MSITLDEVRHVARLARLDLDEGEIFQLQSELNGLLGLFEDIEELNLGSGEGVACGVALQNVWAADMVGDCLTTEEALRNAPRSKGALFVVPAIIED